MDTLLTIIVATLAAMLVAALLWICNRKTRTDDNDVYNSGLNRKDWGQLKDVLLSAMENESALPRAFENLPCHLKAHAVGKIIAGYLDGDDDASLDVAANLMTNGTHNAWLALSKS
jgi:hypothetical protein